MSVKKFFREAIDYLGESRKFVYLSALVFFFFAVVGFIFAGQLGFLDKIILEIIKSTEGLDSFQLIVYIFRNNFLSALGAVAFGILLGIFPLFNAISNGLVLGYVAAKTVSAVGFLSLWRILPHGIFELPAIFIAIGTGMKLGMIFFVPKKKMKKELFYRIDRSLKVIVFIIFPLLSIAAVIEGLLIGFLG